VHVLVVDDQEKILSFLRKGLQAEGYVVTTATDAETALDAARGSVGVRRPDGESAGDWLCSADLAMHCDAGGGTRTPDTRGL
jgi:CheY-like chemotaxis protein